MDKEKIKPFFTGTYNGELKGYGAVDLPKKFQSVMGKAGIEQLFLEIPESFDDWEEGILVSSAEALRNEIQSEETPLRRKAEILKLASSPQSVYFGRMNIPKDLREKAGLGKNITFTAMGERFVIEDKAKAKIKNAEAEADPQSLLK